MNGDIMHESNQSPAPLHGLWQLGPNDVRQLPALPVARWLTVRQGRLWVTPDAASTDEARDIWLEAGDELRLPPGSRWWVEAWPRAQAQLLEEPPAKPVSRPGLWTSVQAWMPAWRLA